MSGAHRDDVGVRLGPPHPAEPRRRRIALYLAGREHADPEHGGALEPAGEEAEELAAVFVAPLQVVDRDDNRPLRGERGQQLRHALEQSPALARLRLRRRERRESVADLGHHACHLGEPFGRRAGESRCGQRVAERLDDRLVGNPCAVVVASAAQNGAAIGDHPAEELVREPGLADAGLALDQEDLPVAPPRPLPRGPQGLPLRVPADEARLESGSVHVPLVGDDGRRVGGAPIGFDPADQRLERPARLAARLLSKQVTVLGVPAQSGATVASQVARLDGQLSRLIRDRIGGQPPIGQIDGLAPAPLRHRLARGPAQDIVILAEQPTAGGRDPFVEERGPPYREPFQEAGNVERGGLRRRLVEKRAKRGDVAVERSGELDHGPVGPDPVAERVPQVLEGLPQGGTRLDFGRLAPEKAGQRLTALRPTLELEIRQEGQGFGAERGRDRVPLARGEDRRAQQGEDESGHSGPGEFQDERTGPNRKGKCQSRCFHGTPVASSPWIRSRVPGTHLALLRNESYHEQARRAVKDPDPRTAAEEAGPVQGHRA